MLKRRVSLGLLIFAFSATAQGENGSECVRQMSDLPGHFSEEQLQKICGNQKRLESCSSVQGAPIFHFDYSAAKPLSKRVLVFALTHGDEPEGGGVALQWMERLSSLDSRSSWRIVPIVNPDGWRKKTRVNQNGVDLNRNFPSQDWDRLALKWWKTKKKEDPRRYPGAVGASEPETRCMMAHLEAYDPDFVVSIHTPYGVLDFDGPRRIGLPEFSGLRWVSLGTFPGSLGRFLWVDRKIPVMTIELKDSGILNQLHRIESLQDISGTVAIRSSRALKSRSKTR